ncbi:MAG: thiamine-phosphate kinase, partial [Rhodothermales bacterium]|nr:thiamine-phosphate kinase [Rhodothermales bacterium]
YRYVIERQLRPRARTNVVEQLAAANIRPTAMIDVSDGVASEVNHIARQSGVGATVRIAALPFDAETRLVADENMADVDTYALFGGEDYELLFTIDPSDLQAIDDMEGLSVIGTIEEKDSGVNALSPDQGLIPLHPAGFDHFAPPEDGSIEDTDPGAGGDGYAPDADA